MKAVILSAGMCTRIRDIIKDKPKGLIEIGEQSLLERSIKYLKSHEIDEIVIVVGYQQHKIFDVLGDTVTYIQNPWFERTNSMASLWFASPFLYDQDFLYLHSDLLYHPKLLELCISVPNHDIVLLVEKKRCDSEDMKVVVENGRLVFSSKNIPIERAFGEWTGIARF